jgi:hypothetical protein
MEAAFCQTFFALFILSLLTLVDFSVQLDDQSDFVAVEVDNEAFDDLLPPKMVAAKPVATQSLPQECLGGGHIPA